MVASDAQGRVDARVELCLENFHIPCSLDTVPQAAGAGGAPDRKAGSLRDGLNQLGALGTLDGVIITLCRV